MPYYIFYQNTELSGFRVIHSVEAESEKEAILNVCSLQNWQTDILNLIAWKKDPHYYIVNAKDSLENAQNFDLMKSIEANKVRSICENLVNEISVFAETQTLKASKEARRKMFEELKKEFEPELK